MTNYNERLDEILSELHSMKPSPMSPPDFRKLVCNDAKQAITSLIKELVAEARIDELQMIETAQQNTDQWGNFCIDDTSDFSNYIGSRISELEQNLLKALEEV